MARKIKFALEMANGVKVRSNLEELRENFDIDKAIGHFLSGKLVEWLEDRYYEDEAEKISVLDKDSPDFRQKFCDVLGVEYDGGENLDVEFLARLNEKKNYLRQKTDEKSIVANADKTALNQEDLSDLLDIDEPIIYLCGENFNIPIRVENKKYVGILGTPKIEIKANSRSELDAKNINFENCILPNNLQEKKKSVSPVNVTSIHGGSSSSGSYKNRKSISELQSILVNCYEPMHIHAQDRDYGDLWHINHGGEFVDERFERIRKSFTKGDEPINDREKAFALPLICHGRYGESDLVRIGVIREEKKAIGNQTEADRYIGFALTKDSFCMKGMWLADCIIPYGNIQEVKDSGTFDDKEIIFSINSNETGRITLSRDKSYSRSFDWGTLEQLQKYLNVVKEYYSLEYDKLFLKSTDPTGPWGSKTPWLRTGAFTW